MAEFFMDKRDIEFVLFEQFNLGKFSELERYEDFDEDDYRGIIETALNFAKEEIAPLDEPSEEFGCKLENGQVKAFEGFKDLYKQYGEDGWIAVSQNQEYGGMGLPLAMSILLQEFGIAAAGSFMFFPGLTSSAGHLVENFANKNLAELLVPKMYQGEWTGTMCLTEPQAGSAVGDLTTSAVPIGPDDTPTAPVEGLQEYRITGNKIFISAGDHDLTDNIIHLVLARVQGDPAGTKGISLFVVPKYRFDSEGNVLKNDDGSFVSNDVTTTAIEHKMGIAASPTCALSFGDNGDCRGYLVGEQRKGIVYMFQMMNEARIACGVQGSALGNLAYQRALAYAKERVQGPKVTDRSPEKKSVPIINHPDVRRNLMLARSYSEGLRALLFQAAIYADYSEYHHDEEVRKKNRALLELLTPVCKAYASDKGFKVTELAIQIFGGYGYIKDYGVEKNMRDVKIASIYEGTNGIQALDLLGRKMRMKDGAYFMTWLQETNEFLQQYKSHESLAELVAEVDKAKNTLGDVAFHFMGANPKDIEVTLLGATPFLEIFGHVEVARLLLHQAIVADEKLKAILKENDVAEDVVAEFIKNSPNARFYNNKIKTARFFVYHTLPHVKALAKEIKSNDRSALEVDFD